MNIYYSPYFNGHSYIDYEKRQTWNGGLLGETLESTEGLLSRLELMCGTAYPDWDIEEKRIEEYYDVLTKSIGRGNTFYDSIRNDSNDKCRYNVTTELLRWRDTLILAGWEILRQAQQPVALPGKLCVVSDAEKNVPSDGYIIKGSADRWLSLYQSRKASVLHKKDSKVKVEQGTVNIKEKVAGNEIRFTPQLEYDIHRNVEVSHPRMSATTLDNVIQLPFNHIVEKELGLYEPFDDTDVTTMKGTVAHKVVELMVDDMNRIDTSKFDDYLKRALKDPECIDKSIGKCILELNENKFELEDLSMTLSDSLEALNTIIKGN